MHKNLIVNEIMENLRDRTLSGIGWSGIAHIVRQLLLFVVSVILARLLSPREFGLIAMVIVFTGFAELFGDMGLGAALIQKLNLKRSHLSSVFWVNLITGVALTGIVIAVAPLIASFYGEPALKPLAMVIAFNFLIGSFKVVQNALLQKEMNFRKIAMVEISAALIAGAIAVTMALTGFGVWSLVAQSILLTTISVIVLWFISPWRPDLSWNFKALKELLGFSSNLLGFNVLNYWVRNLDNLLIGKFIGSSPLGIYSRAYSLMLLPVTQISHVVSRVMFPALSSIQKDIVKVKRIYLRSTRIIALVTFPMMAGLFVLAEPFILTVLGSKWGEVIPILRLFCITGMGQSIGTTVGWIYTSQGRTDIQFKWGICSGIVRAIAFIIGLRWGILGVATAYVLSGYVILWYPAWAIPGRLINLKFSEMLKNISGTFFCAIAMSAVMWAFNFLLPQELAHWVYLAILIPIGIIVYFVMVHLFKLKSYIDVKQLLKEHRQRKSEKK